MTHKPTERPEPLPLQARGQQTGADPENLERLQLAAGGVELTPAEARTLEWIAGWEDNTVINLCSIVYKARAAERARALSRDKLTRKDLLEAWGFLDVLSGFYRAKATAAAERKDTTGDKLTANYIRRVSEITALQRKITAETDGREEG